MKSTRARRRAQTILASAITATAVLGSSGGAVAAPAAASHESLRDLGAALFRVPAFAAVPDSATLSVPVMLHGTLTDTDGMAMSGAQVLVSAWPSNQQIHRVPIGAPFRVTPLARAVARGE